METKKKAITSLGIKTSLSSISWALVTLPEEGFGSIIAAGVREMPLSVKEKQSFERVQANKEAEERHLRKSARRNRQRYRQRRDVLKDTLIRHGLLDSTDDWSAVDTPRVRAKAAMEKVTLHELGRVLMIINRNRGYKSNRRLKSSGDEDADTEYKKAMSLRSAELKEKGITVGQWLMLRQAEDPAAKIRGFVFYRKDHEDEFDRIWEVQKQYHPELTDSLYRRLKKLVIFYQRDLKSQKDKVLTCPLESKVIEKVNGYGKKVKKLQGRKVAPKSSPMFQEYRVWNDISNIRITDKNTGEMTVPSPSDKKKLAAAMRTQGEMSSASILRCLGLPTARYDVNFKKIKGNETMAAFHACAKKIFDAAGHTYPAKCRDKEAYLRKTLEADGINMEWLDYDTGTPSSEEHHNQLSFRLWHLIYSYKEDSTSTDGEGSLRSKISQMLGTTDEQSIIVSSIPLVNAYASFSHKAMGRLLPHIIEGATLPEAMAICGYTHNSTTAFLGEDEDGNLKQFPKNALMNPTAEKICNQFIGIVADVIKTYGQPDKIVMEYDRELKSSKKKRLKILETANARERENRTLAEEIRTEYGIQRPTPKDIQKYRLYKELEKNGYRTLYSNRFIPKEMVFNGSDELTMDHILPKAIIFDESWSNRTLEYRDVNSNDKGAVTAMDFVRRQYGEEEAQRYRERVETLYKAKAISAAKKDKLLMSAQDIPKDLLDRQVQSLPYALKVVKQLMERHFGEVLVSLPDITSKIVGDWELGTLLKKINTPLFLSLGLASKSTMPNGTVRTVTHDSGDWSSRTDARGSLVHAVAVAFTKRSWIQYLNEMNSRTVPGSAAKKIEEKETTFKGSKRIFIPPMPLDELQDRCTDLLKSTLVSIKARKKVTSVKMNRFKDIHGNVKEAQKTIVPRGRLHAAYLRGLREVPVKYEAKVDSSMTAEKIAEVCNPRYRKALLERLAQFGNNPEEAFSGKNKPSKNPVWTDDLHLNKVPEKVTCEKKQTWFVIRKPITPELFKSSKAGLSPEDVFSKVFDKNAREILVKHYISHGCDLTAAFGNLEQTPIWINKGKGIRMLSVTIGECTDKPQLIRKYDDARGRRGCFAEPDGNDHTAVYKDSQGRYHYRIVTFRDAVQRNVDGLDAVDKTLNEDKGWTFVNSFRKNEMFVFPDLAKGFDPWKIDLEDPDNREIISPHLFRMQSMCEGNFKFRLHYDRNSPFPLNTKDIFWKNLKDGQQLSIPVKVTVDKLGRLRYDDARMPETYKG